MRYCRHSERRQQACSASFCSSRNCGAVQLGSVDNASCRYLHTKICSCLRTNTYTPRYLHSKINCSCRYLHTKINCNCIATQSLSNDCCYEGRRHWFTGTVTDKARWRMIDLDTRSVGRPRSHQSIWTTMFTESSTCMQCEPRPKPHHT